MSLWERLRPKSDDDRYLWLGAICGVPLAVGGAIVLFHGSPARPQSLLWYLGPTAGGIIGFFVGGFIGFLLVHAWTRVGGKPDRNALMITGASLGAAAGAVALTLWWLIAAFDGVPASDGR